VFYQWFDVAGSLVPCKATQGSLALAADATGTFRTQEFKARLHLYACRGGLVVRVTDHQEVVLAVWLPTAHVRALFQYMEVSSGVAPGTAMAVVGTSILNEDDGRHRPLTHVQCWERAKEGRKSQGDREACPVTWLVSASPRGATTAGSVWVFGRLSVGNPNRETFTNNVSVRLGLSREKTEALAQFCGPYVCSGPDGPDGPAASVRDAAPAASPFLNVTRVQSTVTGPFELAPSADTGIPAPLLAGQALLDVNHPAGMVHAHMRYTWTFPVKTVTRADAACAELANHAVDLNLATSQLLNHCEAFATAAAAMATSLETRERTGDFSAAMIAMTTCTHAVTAFFDSCAATSRAARTMHIAFEAAKGLVGAVGSGPAMGRHLKDVQGSLGLVTTPSKALLDALKALGTQATTSSRFMSDALGKIGEGTPPVLADFQLFKQGTSALVGATKAIIDSVLGLIASTADIVNQMNAAMCRLAVACPPKVEASSNPDVFIAMNMCEAVVAFCARNAKVAAPGCTQPNPKQWTNYVLRRMVAGSNLKMLEEFASNQLCAAVSPDIAQGWLACCDMLSPTDAQSARTILLRTLNNEKLLGGANLDFFHAIQRLDPTGVKRALEAGADPQVTKFLRKDTWMQFVVRPDHFVGKDVATLNTRLVAATHLLKQLRRFPKEAVSIPSLATPLIKVAAMAGVSDATQASVVTTLRSLLANQLGEVANLQFAAAVSRLNADEVAFVLRLGPNFPVDFPSVKCRDAATWTEFVAQPARFAGADPAQRAAAVAAAAAIVQQLLPLPQELKAVVKVARALADAARPAADAARPSAKETELTVANSPDQVAVVDTLKAATRLLLAMDARDAHAEHWVMTLAKTLRGSWVAKQLRGELFAFQSTP
jgi:hypothetical protein